MGGLEVAFALLWALELTVFFQPLFHWQRSQTMTLGSDVDFLVKWISGGYIALFKA